MMSVMNQSGEEQVECPLCMEPLEVDDLNFYPCTCGYQICRFCWHRIRTDENGLCPACRKAYPENPADFKPLTQEEVAKLKAEKRHKDQQRKQKITENRKHLSNVRVVQRNLVFVVGLPMRLADSEVLKKHEYFGKFGKIHKVVINQSTSYAGSQGPSASAYVTYHKADDALRAIQAVNNIVVDGRTIKTSLGTTKYCSHFMKNQTCPKPDCMYLHDLGDVEASFTKEEMQQGKHQEYERKLHEQLLNSYNQGNKDRKPTPSPPAVALNSMNCMTIGSSSGCCVSLSNSNTMQASQSCNKEAWPSLQQGVPTPGTNCSGSSTSTSSISSNSSGNSSSNSSTSSSNNGNVSGSNISCGILSGSSNSHHGNSKGERRQKFDHNSYNIPSKGSGQSHKKRHGAEDHRGKGKEKLHNSSHDEHSNKTVHCKNLSHGTSRVNTKSGKESHDVQKIARCQNQTNCDINVVSGESRGASMRMESDVRDIETEVKSSGSETSECTVSRGSSVGGRALQSHRAATLFEPDNNSFFSSNNFTKVSASTAGSAGSDWPLSSLTLTHMPDVLPPVHSSEDWQAAFGFSNSGAVVPVNEVDSLNRQVVSETPSSSSEYSGGKDGDNCDPVSFDSQNGQQISVQGYNCHSSHSSSSENVSSNAVQNSPDEYRLTEVVHLNHKLKELMLEESVSNGVVSDDAAGPVAGCEMSAEEMTLHNTANCENPNVVPCSQSHLYPNMPSPAFVQDPTVFMVNRHPFMQSGNHVIPNGIQPAQAAKFLSEIHLRQQSQVQNSQAPLPAHLRNHPVLEGTSYSRHIIEGGANSKFVLNTNSFGGTVDGTNLLTYTKIGRVVQKLPNTTSSESEENSGVSDNEKYSNYDTLERQTSCENSSDEFVEYNGDSENSAQENNEEMSPKENQRATDDDLGFDPFHETQKALAEMMEKENMMLMLQGQQNHVPHPNSHINHLNQLHQQYHQLNHMNHHPAQFTQATMFGGTKILPSCHAPLQPHLLQNNHRLQPNVAAANTCSKMDGLALGPGPGPGSIPPRARLPPPGFTTAPNHMNAFGLGIPRAPTNTGSKILPFMGLGNGTSSTNTGTSSPIPQNLNSISANISISALNAQQNVNNVNPTPLLFPHSNNHTSTASQLNSTFSAQNGAVAHSSTVPKSASDSFNAKEWPDNLRSLLPNINTGSGVSQSPVPVAFSGSNTPTPPSPPPPPSSQNSSYAAPAHTPAQTNPVKTWTGAGPCSDWTALDPAIMSSRPHSIFSSSSVTPQHPIILCNTNSVLNQQSPNTQYLHLQNTTHWLRSLASDGCLLYGANISQNMSNSDWTVQSHHSNSIAPPPPGFSLRMTTQQTAIQNKLAVSASQEITKIENI